MLPLQAQAVLEQWLAGVTGDAPMDFPALQLLLHKLAEEVQVTLEVTLYSPALTHDSTTSSSFTQYTVGDPGEALQGCMQVLMAHVPGDGTAGELNCWAAVAPRKAGQ